MNKKLKDRLVGGLGGGGGALVLLVIINYLLFPSWQESIWGLSLAFGIIGGILIVTAIAIQIIYRKIH